MSPAKLSQLIKRYYWFHSLDLGHGIITPGAKSLDVHRAEYAAFFDPVEVYGRTVIDIGAWNGAYSFEAKRRGASRVLATDHFTWAHSDLLGRESFDLALSALDLDIEALDIDIPDLCPDRVGVFDIVLFLGVFYHLFDPIAGLANAAKLAREVLVVETHIDALETRRPAMVFFPGDELSGDVTNWWGPNPALMVALLKSFGFAKVDAAWSFRPGHRAVFHAWRSDKLRRCADSEHSISAFSPHMLMMRHGPNFYRRWQWLRALRKSSSARTAPPK